MQRTFKNQKKIQFEPNIKNKELAHKSVEKQIFVQIISKK